MSNMLKKNMSLSMMKKQSLCTLPCTPVSWRALRACASVVRVRENWRCEKVRHTHLEKHVCAHVVQLVEHDRSEHAGDHVVAAEAVSNITPVDGGPGACRGFARVER